MTSRHHYSIPGASFLKPRTSLKTKSQAQNVTAPTSNVPSSSRPRQPSFSNAPYIQEAVVGNAAPVRPPSAGGYRTQHSNASVNRFHASSGTRPPSVQRPTTTPPASSSRTRFDVPGTRSYFSKMFGRKQTPAPAQEERQKSSSRQRRVSQTFFPTPMVPVQAPYPAGPSASRTSYDAMPQALDSDRDDQNKQKIKQNRVRSERTKDEVERLHMEYAAHRVMMEQAEREQAAAAKLNRADRTAFRPSLEEARQQEYESDNARRRPQAHQMGHSSVRQEARQSQYLHPAQVVPITASRPTVPVRDSQQVHVSHMAFRSPGVSVQPSASSSSTPVSHQGQALHSALPSRTERITTPNLVSVSASTGLTDSPPALPPKASPVTQQQHPLSQKPSHHSRTSAVPNVPPTYPAPGTDNRHRLEREARERDVLLSQERERVEKERELAKRREAEKEALEREAVIARERERNLELERRREAEREMQQQRERELDRERRRARRAERERKKELENAEREWRKEFERAEREQQRQAERAGRERLKALEEAAVEKQKEADCLRRERKEKERAERERQKAEFVRQQEAERLERERLERERLREKAERERERANKSATKHRSAPSQFGAPIASSDGSSQTHALVGGAENQNIVRPQEDSPPPLTPSSSHESHEEILMTPASLDQARTQVDVQQAPEISHRPEKKEGGLLRIFRSSSIKAFKDKEARDRADLGFKKQANVMQQNDQRARAESLSKPRSTRPPSVLVTAAEANPNPTNAGPAADPVPSSDLHSKQQSRMSKHLPPPINIPPPQWVPYRLVGSKSRRYRMSSASLEAVDGTANNTVVGSPTSSRRSPTPSGGPMTPPIRDPIEATIAWRSNEDDFLDPGSRRRRRPGVTFDLKDNSDGQTDGAQYRQSRHLPRQRRGSPR